MCNRRFACWQSFSHADAGDACCRKPLEEKGETRRAYFGHKTTSTPLLSPYCPSCLISSRFRTRAVHPASSRFFGIFSKPPLRCFVMGTIPELRWCDVSEVEVGEDCLPRSDGMRSDTMGGTLHYRKSSHVRTYSFCSLPGGVRTVRCEHGSEREAT
jgi:hypothetical protein